MPYQRLRVSAGKVIETTWFRMSNDIGRCRPSVLQYIAYCFGRVLLDLKWDWVRNNLGGKGAQQLGR